MEFDLQAVKRRAEAEFGAHEVVFLGQAAGVAAWDVQDAIAPQRVSFAIAERRYTCDCASFKAGAPTCLHIEIVALHRARRRGQTTPQGGIVATKPPAAGPPAVPVSQPEPAGMAGAFEPAVLGFLGALAEGLGRLLAGQRDQMLLLEKQNVLLERIAAGQAAGGATEEAQEEAPDWRFPLAEWASFDWPSIGALATARDEDGITVVRWGKRLWYRRSPENKFKTAVWYSRAEGRNEDGTPHYVRLVTFEPPRDVQPLGRKAAKEAGL